MRYSSDKHLRAVKRQIWLVGAKEVVGRKRLAAHKVFAALAPFSPRLRSLFFLLVGRVMLEFLFSFKFALRLINRFAVVLALLPRMPAKTTADNEMIQSSNCIMFWQKARSLVPSSESFFKF